jgi:Na+-transporting NADH:ubiquinone oxidoreductase subunit NqrF
MATSVEVLGMLIPNGGYVQTGTDYEGIEFIDCDPITKKQYTDGFAQFDAWKAQQDADKAAAKSDLLAKLGITEDEAQLLLS